MIRTAGLVSLALACPAGAFELVQPVDCTLGAGCYIQQYFDHDPGPSATDFTCGPLSYDGHDGTDFAVPTRRAMEKGIAVVAAAAGTVKGVRDGVADFAPATEGRECGNGVVIDHGRGWETQYCHLKQGSVLVKPGETVQAATPLGLIGQSGQADFPHLHLSVRQNGVEIDPFAPGASACGPAGDDLWSSDLPLLPGGLLDIGITAAVPEYDLVRAGLPSPDLPAAAPALVVWAYYFGPREGDEIHLWIRGPDGEVISRQLPIEKTQALAFRAIGQKLTADGWPPGRYVGSATLFRGGRTIDHMWTVVTVKP